MFALAAPQAIFRDLQRPMSQGIKTAIEGFLKTVVSKDFSSILTKIDVDLVAALQPLPPPPPPYSPAAAFQPLYIHLFDEPLVAAAKFLLNDYLSPTADGNHSIDHLINALTNDTGFLPVLENWMLRKQSAATLKPLGNNSNTEIEYGVEALNISNLGTVSLLHLSTPNNYSVALLAMMDSLRVNLTLSYKLKTKQRPDLTLFNRINVVLDMVNISLAINMEVAIKAGNNSAGKMWWHAHEECFRRRVKSMNVTSVRLGMQLDRWSIDFQDVLRKEPDFTRATNNAFELVLRDYVPTLPAILSAAAGSAGPSALNELIWAQLRNPKPQGQPVHCETEQLTSNLSTNILQYLLILAVVLAVAISAASIHLRSRYQAAATAAAAAANTARPWEEEAGEEGENNKTPLLPGSGDNTKQGSAAVSDGGKPGDDWRSLAWGVSFQRSLAVTVAVLLTAALLGVSMISANGFTYYFILQQEGDPLLVMQPAFGKFSLVSYLAGLGYMHSYVMSVIACALCGLCPFARLGMLLAAWHLPPRMLGVGRRESLLRWSEFLGKWAFLYPLTGTLFSTYFTMTVGGDRNFFGLALFLEPGVLLWTG